MTDEAPSSAPGGHPQLALPVALVVLAAAMIWGTIHAHQLQFFCDDSYISYRFAQNFAEGHGLVYNPGERVEGYTNFLWVVVLGLGMMVGFSAEFWSLLLGCALLLGTAYLAFRLACRLTGSAVHGALSAVFLASLGPLVLWATSGLESIAFAAAALAALVQYDRRSEQPRGLFLAGLLYATSTMVRPDGAIFGAVAGLHLIADGLIRRVPLAALLRRGLALLGGYLALLLPFMLWRHWYYDDWFPNTFYVKTGSSTQWAMGTEYLFTFAREYYALWWLMLAGLAVGLLSPSMAPHRRTLGHLGLAIAGFSLYVARAGGDYMTLFRFSVPMLAPAVVLAVVAVAAAARWLEARTAAPAGWALIAVSGAAFAFVSYPPTRDSVQGRAISELLNSQHMMKRNTERWVAAGKQLQKVLWDDARIATTAAGALPYYSEAWTLDQSGLCDRHTAKEEWDPWLLHKPGHQKQATRRYLTQIDPPVDIVLHHPQLAAANPFANIPPPDRDSYVTRALKIEGLTDDEGNPMYLYFALHKRRMKQAQEAGMVDPASFPMPTMPSGNSP